MAAAPNDRMHRSQLSQSVHESEGFSVYEAIVDQINWQDRTPWLSLLYALNASQRAVVAVAQVHEHAQVNGLRASVDFHGQEVVEMAADGAARLGNTKLESMIREALAVNPNWEALEAKWDREAEFEIESFIEEHAPEFLWVNDAPLLRRSARAGCTRPEERCRESGVELRSTGNEDHIEARAIERTFWSGHPSAEVPFCSGFGTIHRSRF